MYVSVCQIMLLLLIPFLHEKLITMVSNFFFNLKMILILLQGRSVFKELITIEWVVVPYPEGGHKLLSSFIKAKAPPLTKTVLNSLLL